MLPWSWAVQRLEQSHDYWVATAEPDGTPHVMPVWGVWLQDAIWFSSSRGSRRARNLAQRPRCSIATDNAQEPVIMEGGSELISEMESIARFLAAVNAKYQTAYDMDFFAAPTNACYCVRPTWAFGLMESDFTGSPTRWVFP